MEMRVKTKVLKQRIEDKFQNYFGRQGIMCYIQLKSIFEVNAWRFSEVPNVKCNAVLIEIPETHFELKKI